MTLICSRQTSLSCPRTWAGWIPVTSTGMRWGGERRCPKQASGMATRGLSAASTTRHGPFSATPTVPRPALATVLPEGPAQQCLAQPSQPSCRAAHPNHLIPVPHPSLAIVLPGGPPQPPLYLHIDDFVRKKRLSLLPGGHPARGVAASPVLPPATTVDEPGIVAIVTYDRTVAWFQPHAQGRLP